ncbi:MAG: hypothetical protein BWK76_08785 [Desulfobulbaceae bacterium A2]|nr:MAG: hypothetical protein BWK76_08785 [Desulfobulbaceae bacterium A2]
MQESNWFFELLGNTFVRGLLLGLLAALVVGLRGYLRGRELKHELRKLREHLHTKLEIDSEENERRKQELLTIKQERDNLRNSVQLLQQKPGRHEIRQYYVYQKAVDIMFEKAPGFAPAWQITVKEAEAEMERAERGLIPFIKRMVPSSPARQIEEYEKLRKKEIEQHGNA